MHQKEIVCEVDVHNRKYTYDAWLVGVEVASGRGGGFV